jgi:hypothetical protein
MRGTQSHFFRGSFIMLKCMHGRGLAHSHQVWDVARSEHVLQQTSAALQYFELTYALQEAENLDDKESLARCHEQVSNGMPQFHVDMMLTMVGCDPEQFSFTTWMWLRYA